jgi:hypothetical protein
MPPRSVRLVLRPDGRRHGRRSRLRRPRRPLHDQQAVHGLYLPAAAVGLVSAAVIALSGPDPGRAATCPAKTAGARSSFAEQLRTPGLATGFAIHLVLALALYDQFNAGLPDLVLTGLILGALMGSRRERRLSPHGWQA